MPTQFDNPGSTAALDMKELDGRLLLIKPLRVEVGVKTVHGPKDATVADVHIVDGDDPREISEAFIWPAVLQSQVHRNVGTDRYVLGRLGQGTAKPGQSPPWKLADATDDDQVAAERYLNRSRIVPPADTVTVITEAPDGTVADGDKPPF